MSESAVMVKVQTNDDAAMNDDGYLEEDSMPAPNEKLIWEW